MFIDDLVKGMISFMNADVNFIGPLNIGNPHEISINQLASIIIELTDSKSGITYNKIPEDDPKKRKPDISVISDKLSWKPLVNLEEGLKKTIHYFSNL